MESGTDRKEEEKGTRPATEARTREIPQNIYPRMEAIADRKEKGEYHRFSGS